ncbi:MAG TPA: 16S rRNA (uracil(1498)-N(3))-methyltransferase [Bacilli bacterium]|nr:16S rRNA (uracil(1498)-N(3))-methyltransferase [Bacilli bacterium]
MQRYFINENDINGENVVITGKDYHHIKNVMRMRKDEQVIVCTNKGIAYLASVEAFLEAEVCLKIVNRLEDKVELDVEVTIAHGLVRREKAEEVIRRLSELGASYYLPVTMERSIIKVKDNENRKNERQQLIAKEASEQAHRTKVMQISEIISFTELLKIAPNYDLCLVAYEEKGRDKDLSLMKLLKAFTKQQILVVIGPEGGFSPREINLLTAAAFHLVGLGPRILRTETAPLYVMSAISYQLELGEDDEN